MASKSFGPQTAKVPHLERHKLKDLRDDVESAFVTIEGDINTRVFVSAEQTGNGAAQNIAHGLSATPTKVYIALTGGPAAYSQPTITPGTHDATNVVATVTTGWKYRVWASL